MTNEVPERVLAAFGWQDLSCAPTGTGLINDTFKVADEDGPVAIVQRLHPIFGPEVNIDLEAVSLHLAGKGLETPQLIRTRNGERHVLVAGRPWRALTYVPGRCFDNVREPAMAEAAGELVGQFHRALDDFEHDYAFTRAGVHDTAAHLDKLRRLSDENGDDDQGRALADSILAAASRLPTWSDLPRRHGHGDLKLSNVRFDHTGQRALCLIDLDTCGRQLIPYELGDALRSWCNTAGEDTDGPAIDLDILTHAARGYARGSAGLLTDAEVDAIIPGLQTICVELASRFAADVFEDSYFGWDRTRFPSRRAHNLVRARGQLALARAALEAAAPARAAVRAAFAAETR